MKVLLIAVMLVHSWYDENCCHDKDCHPVPCEQIEKLREVGCGAMRRPSKATCFQRIALRRRTTKRAMSVSHRARSLAASASIFRSRLNQN